MRQTARPSTMTRHGTNATSSGTRHRCNGTTSTGRACGRPGTCGAYRRSQGAALKGTGGTSDMSEGVRELAHVSFSLTDFERNVAWYEVLGLHRIRRRSPGGRVTFTLTCHAERAGDRFDERRTGMDHVSFRAGPDELTAWEHDWSSWASITPASSRRRERHSDHHTARSGQHPARAVLRLAAPQQRRPARAPRPCRPGSPRPAQSRWPDPARPCPDRAPHRCPVSPADQRRACG